MSVHVLSDGIYALVRCNRNGSEQLRDVLEKNNFICGKNRDVDGIPAMIDIAVGRKGEDGNVSWKTINGDELRELLRDNGFDVRS